MQCKTLVPMAIAEDERRLWCAGLAVSCAQASFRNYLTGVSILGRYSEWGNAVDNNSALDIITYVTREPRSSFRKQPVRPWYLLGGNQLEVSLAYRIRSIQVGFGTKSEAG